MKKTSFAWRFKYEHIRRIYRLSRYRRWCADPYKTHKDPIEFLETTKEEVESDDQIEFQDAIDEIELENQPLPVTFRRRPGALRIIRTGQPGQRRKYNMISVQEVDVAGVEEIFVAEILMNDTRP